MLSQLKTTTVPHFKASMDTKLKTSWMRSTRARKLHKISRHTLNFTHFIRSRCVLLLHGLNMKYSWPTQKAHSVACTIETCRKFLSSCRLTWLWLVHSMSLSFWARHLLKRWTATTERARLFLAENCSLSYRKTCASRFRIHLWAKTHSRVGLSKTSIRRKQLAQCT